MRPAKLLLLGAAVAALPAFADEGMWTYHGFPTSLVQQKYGASIDRKWLDHVRQSTIRLSNCTATFVSPNGLILTNHHCAAACVYENSTQEKDLLREGFLADARGKELRCGTQVADVLMEVEDITAKVAAATGGLDAKAANDRRRKTLTALEQSCEKASAEEPRKCESVTLYEGGQYWLYKYRRYTDVRLAFAPEESIAAFGGDPDNFQFPRWCLDMALLRAYDSSGNPARPAHFLKMDFAGPDAGELVFVSGHPGSTNRLLTVSQLEDLRAGLPRTLMTSSELRGRYIQYSKAGDEAARTVFNPLASLENTLKVRRKQLDALLEDGLMQHKRAEEAALRERVKADASLAARTGDPWREIESTKETDRALTLPYAYLEGGSGFNSRLFRYARTLVRAAAEVPKENTERLPEYSDTGLPRVKQQLAASVPVYPQIEKLTLSFSLERMREWLGPDHPVVRQLLSKESPDELAARLVDGSKLADPAIRAQLWDGGAQAVAASRDPMIALAQAVDEASRAVRKRYEDEVEAPVEAASERIAQARFAALGTSVAPDATFTLRLNFGTVAGWSENGAEVEPYTRLGRLFERATGARPFEVPPRWLAAKDRLDPSTKFNLSTDNDIVGGNSGSALIDARGNIVGLIFDGNIHSISGSYWFDAAKNRAIAVHPAIMREGLEKVYGARGLLAELAAQ